MLLNRERASAIMAAQGLEALVASTAENVTYATGYANWPIYTFKDPEAYAVVPEHGDPVLVVPVSAVDYLAETPVNVSRIYTYGTYHVMRNFDAVLEGAEAQVLEIQERASHHPDALTALTHVLADLEVGRTIGVDERGIPPSQWKALLTALPGRTVAEAHEVFRTIRRVKTPNEIDRLRMCVAAVEAGMTAAFQRAASGTTEAELEATFRAVVGARGVTPGHYETSAGTRSSGSFPPSPEYRLKRGDIIRSDCGGRYQGYWADTGRTAVLGEPAAKLARYYEALRVGIASVLATIKPGVQVAELFRVGVEAVRTSGIPHYRRHHVGHAIGLEFYEAPVLTDFGHDERPVGRKDVLEPGMVINIELPYYELGLGGLQIEDTIVVRPGGYERLTSAGHDLVVVAGT
jgi:Xaa-Pro dipeptidase